MELLLPISPSANEMPRSHKCKLEAEGQAGIVKDTVFGPGGDRATLESQACLI